jgi:hypothetical protein
MYLVRAEDGDKRSEYRGNGEQPGEPAARHGGR